MNHYTLTNLTVGNWIKNNVKRVDIEVDEVHLIGSQVTGGLHSKSDIDICVLCDGFDYVRHNLEWTLNKSEFDKG
ncbi:MULTISPECIES: nucleotidyltransferase domain-containing protein [Paenibacillus]|uniref:nucleotidyltransferase domain-containing protein n=1 Tax=Paenibacillus TaxID=44249 RepID=UPI0011A4C555